MHLRENLLYLRERDHFTQEKLAEQLGVTRQSVAKWEAGASTPELEKVVALASIFSVSVDELLLHDLRLERTESCPEDNDERTDTEAIVVARPVETEETSALSHEPTSQALTRSAYDLHCQKFATAIGAGVFFIIIGVALTVLWAGLASVGTWPLDFAAVWTLLGVLVGILLIIPAGMSHSRFMKLHPYLSFNYSPEEQETAARRQSVCIAGGVGLIIAGVIVEMIIGVMIGLQELGVAVLLGCVAVAVFGFIYGGVYEGRTDIARYNLEAVRSLDPDIVKPYYRQAAAPYPEKAADTEKRIGFLSGIIMMIATIVGLVLLFTGVHGFWLVWPIGGISCGIASLMLKWKSGQLD